MKVCSGKSYLEDEQWGTNAYLSLKFKNEILEKDKGKNQVVIQIYLSFFNLCFNQIRITDKKNKKKESE